MEDAAGDVVLLVESVEVESLRFDQIFESILTCPSANIYFLSSIYAYFTKSKYLTKVSVLLQI